MVGEDVQKGDGVVGHAVGARVEDLDDAVGALAPAQRHGDDRANAMRLHTLFAIQPRVAFRFRNNERLAVLGHPAGHALAHLHAQVTQRLLLSARGNGVVELLRGFVQHQ